MIYFIQTEDRAAIKIGRAANLRVRLSTLQNSHHQKLTVVRTIATFGYSVSVETVAEKWLHSKFKHLRLKGEWFKFSPEMLTVMPPKNLRAQRGNDIGKSAATVNVQLNFDRALYEEIKRRAAKNFRQIKQEVMRAVRVAYGLPPVTDPGNRLRKLNTDAVHHIRASSEPIAALAKIYSVDPSTISLVRNRKRRANVPDLARRRAS